VGRLLEFAAQSVELPPEIKRGAELRRAHGIGKTSQGPFELVHRVRPPSVEQHYLRPVHETESSIQH
jgi:hypothetical protein